MRIRQIAQLVQKLVPVIILAVVVHLQGIHVLGVQLMDRAAPHVLRDLVMQAIIYQMVHVPNATVAIHQVMETLAVAHRVLNLAVFHANSKHVLQMQPVHMGQKLHLAQKIMVALAMRFRVLVLLTLHVIQVIIKPLIINARNVLQTLIVLVMPNHHAQALTPIQMQELPAKIIAIKPQQNTVHKLPPVQCRQTVQK